MPTALGLVALVSLGTPTLANAQAVQAMGDLSDAIGTGVQGRSARDNLDTTLDFGFDEASGHHFQQERPMDFQVSQEVHASAADMNPRAGFEAADEAEQIPVWADFEPYYWDAGLGPDFVDEEYEELVPEPDEVTSSQQKPACDKHGCTGEVVTVTPERADRYTNSGKPPWKHTTPLLT
jgi:hypothetical protein